MQILLASAKIKHDVLRTPPDVELSAPRFAHEADAFARDMAHYLVEIVAEKQIAGQNKLRFMRFFEETTKMPAILAYHGQAYKHLKAETFTENELRFAQGHLHEDSMRALASGSPPTPSCSTAFPILK